jgi:hypothetical protein
VFVNKHIALRIEFSRDISSRNSQVLQQTASNDPEPKQQKTKKRFLCGGCQTLILEARFRCVPFPKELALSLWLLLHTDFTGFKLL